MLMAVVKLVENNLSRNKQLEWIKITCEKAFHTFKKCWAVLAIESFPSADLCEFEISWEASSTNFNIWSEISFEGFIFTRKSSNQFHQNKTLFEQTNNLTTDLLSRNFQTSERKQQCQIVWTRWIKRTNYKLLVIKIIIFQSNFLFD